MTSTSEPRSFFMTLPVSDLERSKDFYAALGFTFDPAFSGETAARMVISDYASIMLGVPEMVRELSKLPLADSKTHAIGLFSFTVDTREEVNTVADAALAAGGVEADPFEDLGFMCSRSFFDPDNHGWQVMWMDPNPQEA